ncbi:MAG: protein phosphatase 2C domain-containing protein [Clostridiales bacterium]|nr:protein phosphatase 2C domain-containing protein [Peptococcus niger]MDU7244520.1 protein phosphatase 2C domain-containing protein [Clostridiales bacterium]MDU7557097.1 protein phosphatase 2C domain-containing protein [Pseudomonas sp.]
MFVAGRSHIGLVRKTNEDEYYCDGRGRFIIVADGIGGHQNGHIASRMAVNELHWFIEENIDRPPEDLLAEGFKKANEKVHSYQEEQTDGGLMGTTLTAFIIRDGKYYLGHLGDSRAYIMHPGEIVEQISEDHTFLAELAQLDEDVRQTMLANRISNPKNTLMRAIGPEATCTPQISSGNLLPGDVLLLLTDGMYRYTNPEEMSEVIAYTDDLEEVALRFEQLALERGARDNLTIVLYREEGGGKPCKMF